MKKRFNSGLTLVEVSIVALVFIITLVTLLLFYINSIRLTELSFNTTKALFAAQKVLEFYRDYNFTHICKYCPNICNSCLQSCQDCAAGSRRQCIFDPHGFQVNQARGVVYLCKEDGRDNLLRLNIVICFRVGGRIIGEDLDLDGRLDGGEDINGNGVLDSPVEITSLLTTRY